MIGQIVAAQRPEIDILQLVVVQIVKLFELVRGRFASFIGGGETEARFALELHHFFFQRIVNDHEDFLLAHFGHLDTLFENTAAPFAKGYVAFAFLLDFLRFVDGSASHG